MFLDHMVIWLHCHSSQDIIIEVSKKVRSIPDLFQSNRQELVLARFYVIDRRRIKGEFGNVRERSEEQFMKAYSFRWDTSFWCGCASLVPKEEAEDWSFQLVAFQWRVTKAMKEEADEPAISENYGASKADEATVEKIQM